MPVWCDLRSRLLRLTHETWKAAGVGRDALQHLDRLSQLFVMEGLHNKRLGQDNVPQDHHVVEKAAKQGSLTSTKAKDGLLMNAGHFANTISTGIVTSASKNSSRWLRSTPEQGRRDKAEDLSSRRQPKERNCPKRSSTVPEVASGLSTPPQQPRKFDLRRP